MQRPGAGLIVISAGLLALIGVVSASLDPQTYPEYRFRQLQYLESMRPGRDAGPHSPPPGWQHPTGSVVLTGAAIAFESAVVYCVFAAPGPTRVSRRARKGLAVLLPWGCLLALLTVKSAPGFEWLHVMWVWLLIASLFVGALVSAWNRRT